FRALPFQERGAARGRAADSGARGALGCAGRVDCTRTGRCRRRPGEASVRGVRPSGSKIHRQDGPRVIVVITSEAEADLEEIAAYVAEQSLRSALKLMRELRQRCES